uniref:Squalene synthase n=1 Tax=Anthurium amnicola TaxID=1678845 RepID=A0A1D1Z2W5_9ARAE
MGTLRAVLEHPEDLMALVRIKVEAARMKRQIPPQPHWAFCYSMLDKISRTFAFVIQLLPPDLRNAVCIFYLVLRALDTIEDDPNISSDKKVPVLQSYYQHIRDSDWSLSCGREDFKILVDKFHFVSMAFLELEKRFSFHLFVSALSVMVVPLCS